MSLVDLFEKALLGIFTRDYAPRPVRVVLVAIVALLIATIVLMQLTRSTPEFPVLGGLDETRRLMTQSTLAVFIVFIWLTTAILPVRKLSPSCEAFEARVIALLPLSGRAPGDGLLQAAGILAAKTSFPTVNVEVRDSFARSDVARRIIQEKFDSWTPGDPPLWFLVTMSSVAFGLTDFVRGLIDSRPEIRGNFTMIYTVAGSESIKTDREYNIIRYSIDGRQEAERLADFVRGNAVNRNQSVSIIQTNSRYPQDTAMILSGKLNQDFAVQIFEHTEIRMDSNQKSGIAVVIGYDLDMIEAFRNLAHQQFSGKVIGSTTLSVPDWKQYIAREGLLADGVTYHALHYASSPEIGDCFEDALEAHTFDRVTQSSYIYGDARGASAVSRFSQTAREAYTTIEANYVSALCYETVRAFAVMCNLNSRCFYDDPQVEAHLRNNQGYLGNWAPLPYSQSDGHYRPSAELSPYLLARP